MYNMKTKDVNNAIENWLGGHADRSAQDWLIDEMKKRCCTGKGSNSEKKD